MPTTRPAGSLRRPPHRVRLLPATLGTILIAGSPHVMANTKRPNAAPSGTDLPTVQPFIEQPSATQPSATQPSAVQPSTAQPSITQSSITQPSVAQPSAVQPPDVQPSAAQSSIAQPSAAPPSVAQQSIAQPSVVQPSTAQPYAALPAIMQPLVANAAALQLASPTLASQAAPPSAAPPESPLTMPLGALPALASPSVEPPEAPPTGPLSALGRRLDSLGIRLNSLAYDSFENNVSTGENPGRTGNDISVFLGARFDLGKIAGIDGGFLHLQGGYFFARARNGTNNGWLADSSSVLAGLPFINRNQSEYLTNLSYEQKLLSDRLDLEIGRLNAKRAFDLPIPGNSLSNDDAVFTMDGGTSPAPYAHWGVRGAYQISPRWSAGAGAYTVELAENRTFGTDWRFNQATGGLLVANAVYQTSFSQVRAPSRFELVPFFNTSPVKDPLVSERGRSMVQFPGDPAAFHTGAYGIAARVQQTVWRGAGGGARPQHLDLTASLSYTPNQYVVVANYQEVGMTLFGLSPDRPLDAIGAKVAHVSLNSRAIDFEREARISVGGPDVSTGQNEFRLEANAHINLARGVAFEPVAEYIINPDSSGAPFSAKVPKTGFVLAAMLIFYPNEILGLPE